MTIVLTNCLGATFLAVYIFFLGIWKETQAPLTRETIYGMKGFSKLAVPGIIMMCAEWWGFEVNVFLAGLFGVDALAAYTLVFTVYAFLYTVPLSMSISASVKVGNAIGAENVSKAKLVSRLIISLAVAAQIILSSIIFSTRNWWPYLFTSDENVISLVGDITAIFCIFAVIDTAQTTLAGILRGCGKQLIGAVAYLISFYAVGLSVGIYLALIRDMGILGEWIGLTCAISSCFLLVGSYYLCLFNWEAVIADSKRRLEESEAKAAVELVNEEDAQEIEMNPLTENENEPVNFEQ